jgi:predicted metal-dependent phosphoesterase TrpH
MGFADLHIHSIYSHDGTSTIPAILKQVSGHTDLNVIALTDHDTIRGLPEALDLAPRYGIDLIPGCEISSADGHVLALFVDRLIPAGLSLTETVIRVGEIGGLCIAAHPMARGTSSLRFEVIHKALHHPIVAQTLVGIEAFNGGLVYTRGNPIVSKMSQMLPLAQLGNSDAHILEMIGHGSSEFPGRSAQDLRAALIARRCSVREGSGLNGAGVIRRYIPRFVLRKLGWAVWNSGPQAPVTYARLARIQAAVH